MRLKAKVDRNQPEIVDALRRIGAHVQPLHQLGHGVPDLLVSHRGKWLVLEVKDGTLPPSARALTPDQVTWIGQARAPVAVVDSPQSAIDAVMRG